MSESPSTAPSSFPPHSPLEPGDPAELGGRHLHGRLGEGGQGVVYLGSDQERWVAVKWLHARFARDPKARRRFLDEATAMRRVAQFCTAQVIDVGIESDRPFVISEHIDGPSLHEKIVESGAFSGTALYRLAVNTITALAAIHKAGIVHRDFKPANVLLGPDGARVIDFGIARVADATSTTSQLIGTPAYMAPEQFAGDRATSAVDIFAWGTTMAYAASGRLPFGGGSLARIMNRIMHDSPDSQAIAPLTGNMRTLVGQALAKEPKARPRAADLLDALIGGEQRAETETQSENGQTKVEETQVAGGTSRADIRQRARELAAEHPGSYYTVISGLRDEFGISLNNADEVFRELPEFRKVKTVAGKPGGSKQQAGANTFRKVLIGSIVSIIAMVLLVDVMFWETSASKAGVGDCAYIQTSTDGPEDKVKWLIFWEPCSLRFPMAATHHKVVAVNVSNQRCPGVRGVFNLLVNDDAEIVSRPTNETRRVCLGPPL